MYRLSLLPLLALALPALAEPPKFDPAATAKMIAPFIDSQTVAVAHLRVSRVTPAAIDRIGTLLGWDKDARTGVLDKLAAWKDNLAHAGIDDVFLVFGTADQHAPVAFVIPGGTLAQPKDVGGLFATIHPALLDELARDAKHGTFLAGSRAMLDHLKSLKPEARPDLAAAFAAAGEADLQFVLIPSKEQRRVVEEIMPTLPKELGGGPVTVLTAGLRWAALGLDLGEKPALKLTVQARDGDTAKALKALHDQAIDLFGKQTMGDGRPLSDLFGTEFATLRQKLTPKVVGDQMIVHADDAAFARGFAALAGRANEAATRDYKLNNLKQIALAMHNYLSLYDRFPARAGYGLVDIEALKKQGEKFPDLTMKPNKNAKPLLSWRVYMLPYLEQVPLYNEFKLDEPWDSDHNKALIAKIPPVYRSGNATLTKAGKTRMLAPVGKGLMFEPDAPGNRIQDVQDGTSNTILFLEAAEASAVIWSKPDDLTVDEKDPKKGLFDPNATVVLIALADGSVHALPKKIDPKTLWHFFTRAGGEVIVWP